MVQSVLNTFYFLCMLAVHSRPKSCLRKDSTEWCKFQAQKSKRASMLHVLEVQHLKEQNAKGLE